MWWKKTAFGLSFFLDTKSPRRRDTEWRRVDNTDENEKGIVDASQF